MEYDLERSNNRDLRVSFIQNKRLAKERGNGQVIARNHQLDLQH